jgi:TonB family protein
MPRRLVLALLVMSAVPASRTLHAQAAAADAAAQAQRDSAFRAQVRAALAAAGVGDPHGLLLFEGLRASGELQVRVLEGTFPDSALVHVYQTFNGHPETWPADALRMLVRVDPDAFPGQPAIGAEGMPEMQNIVEIAGAISRFVDAHPNLGPAGQTLTARVETVVSRGGDVVFAMVRESSGNAEVDRFAAETAMMMRFIPARADGTPVDAWVTVPIAVPAR